MWSLNSFRSVILTISFTLTFRYLLSAVVRTSYSTKNHIMNVAGIRDRLVTENSALFSTGVPGYGCVP